MNRSASFSAQTAPADSIHETPLIDASDTTASNSIDALVGADGDPREEAGAVGADHRRREHGC